MSSFYVLITDFFFVLNINGKVTKLNQEIGALNKFLVLSVANNSKLVLELALKPVALFVILGGKFKNLGSFIHVWL